MKKSGKSVYRLMSNRYGTDDFYFFIYAVLFVLLFLNLFIDSSIIAVLSMVISVYMIFRALSKDTKKREKENERFLKISGRAKAPFLRIINRFVYRKDYYFRKCSGCGAVLRFEKKKGECRIVCQRCLKTNKFVIKK